MGNNEKVPQAPTGERLLPGDGNEKASEGAPRKPARAPHPARRGRRPHKTRPSRKGCPTTAPGRAAAAFSARKAAGPGMGDGQPTGSSQGLEGAQGSGGGADRFPRR
jgi:hypothetical protein